MDPAGTTFSNNSVDVDAGIDMECLSVPENIHFQCSG